MIVDGLNIFCADYVTLDNVPELTNAYCRLTTDPIYYLLTPGDTIIVKERKFKLIRSQYNHDNNEMIILFEELVHGG